MDTEFLGKIVKASSHLEELYISWDEFTLYSKLNFSIGSAYNIRRITFQSKSLHSGNNKNIFFLILQI